MLLSNLHTNLHKHIQTLKQRNIKKDVVFHWYDLFDWYQRKQMKAGIIYQKTTLLKITQMRKSKKGMYYQIALT